MQSLLRRPFLRLRASKPRGAVGIDWGHPLAFGLRAYVPLLEGAGAAQEFVSRKYADNAGLTYVNQPTAGQNGWVRERETISDAFTAGPRNYDARFWPIWWCGVVNGGQSWTNDAVPLPQLDGRFDITVAVIGMVGRTFGSGLPLFTKSDGSFGWSMGITSTSIPQFNVGNAGNIANSSLAIANGTPFAAIGRLRFPSLDILAVNLLTSERGVGTGSYSSGAPGPTTNTLRLVERTTSTNSRGCAVAAAMWQRALTDSEIDAWIDNPWAMLDVATPRRWFLPSAPPPAPEAAIPAIVRRRQSILPPTKPRRTDLQLDTQNPLTQGMVMCLPFFEGAGVPSEYVSRLRFEQNAATNITWDAPAGSLGLRFLSTIRFIRTIGLDGVDFRLPRNQCTALMIRSPATTGAGQSFGPAIGVADSRSLIANFGGSTAQWIFGSNTLSWSQYVAEAVEVWAFVAGPKGASIWMNGVRRASQATAVAPRDETPGVVWQINQGSGSGVLGTYQFFALFDAEWDEGQIRSWMRDPWQFFKPIPARSAQRALVSPLGPPAPTSSGIGYTGTTRRTKPPAGTPLNWRHPLTQGLRFLLPLNEVGLKATPFGASVISDPFRDIVSGRPMLHAFAAGQGAVVGTPSPLGRSVALGGSSAEYITSSTASIPSGVDAPPLLLDELPTQSIVVALRFRARATNAANVMFSNTRLGGISFRLLMNSDGTINWRVGTNSMNSIGAYRDGNWYTVIGRLRAPHTANLMEFLAFDERGMLLEDTTGGIGASIVTGAGDVGIGSNGGVLGMNADYEWAGVWARYVNDAECGQIAQNPYQIFRDLARERVRSALIAGGFTPPYNPPAPPLALRPRAKPEPGRRLDLENPLVRNLRCYVPFIETSLLQLLGGSEPEHDAGVVFRDQISGRPFINGFSSGVGATRGAPSRTGPSINLNGGANAYITSSEATFPDARDQVPTLIADYNVIPVTLGVKFKGQGGGNGYIFAMSATFGSLNQAALQMIASTHQFRFSSGSASPTTVGAYNDGKWYTVFGTMPAPIINSFPELWVFDEDGILVEHIVSGVQQQWGLANAKTFFGTLGAPGDIEWGGVWHQVLDHREMAQLARDPYVIYQPPANVKARKLLKFVVSTPGTITLTAGIPSAEQVGTPNLVRLALYPTGITTREVHGTPHIGDVDPSGIASVEAVPNPTLIAGDLGVTGIASGEVVSDGVSLLGPPGGTGTVSPSAIASAEAVPSPTLTEVATIYPTGIPSAEDLDNPVVEAPVGTIQPFGIASEEGFSEPVSSGLGPTGGTSLYTLSNAAPPAVGSVTGKKLCSPFLMLLAGMYDTAPSPADILPDVYGDFSVGGLRGPIPAVLVTQTSPWIFIAAAHGVQSIDKVYIDDVEQTGGFVTIPVIALGGGPQVAVIAFTDQPTGVVTWRGKGKMDNAGVLIEDPILQLEDMLLQRGGYTATDFEATTLAEAKSRSSLAAWKTAFVFNTTDQIQAWITEVLFNVMGFWRVTGRAQLQINLDPGGGYTQADLVDSIVASRDVIDGDDGVTFIADREQLVNRLVADYRYSWQEGRYTEQIADETVQDALSINAYGELRKEVTLRGLRDPLLVAQWATILFERQAFETRVEGALVQFQVRGPRLIHATIGDLIAFTWPYGPTREAGNLYINQILRLVQVDQDFTRGGLTSVTAVDTGSYVMNGGVRLLTPVSL